MKQRISRGLVLFLIADLALVVAIVVAVLNKG